ncbi:hypothetical protein DSO57_1001570 [Entomophthora muscae]|uniref:Uncharacterized protein n=1 Tax=Entomophthora muscae TaxID=34485 RepID=A0ACC2SB15_9FUNG|nr:hypothetical protein DSO57_1001570 [Entomophthora muscae]
MDTKPEAGKLSRESSLHTAYRKVCAVGSKSQTAPRPTNRRVPRVSIMDFGGDFFVEVTSETDRILSNRFFGSLIMDINGRSNMQSPLPKRLSRQVLDILIREERVKQLTSGDDDTHRAIKSPSCPNMNESKWRYSMNDAPAAALPKPLPELLRDLPYQVPETSYTKEYSGNWSCGPCVENPQQLMRKASKFSTLDNWIPDLTKSAGTFPLQLYSGHDSSHPAIRRHRSEVSTLVSREWGREATKTPSMLESLLMSHDPILDKGVFHQEPESMDGSMESPILNNEWRAAHFDSDINATLVNAVSPDLTKIPDRFKFPARQTTPIKAQHRLRSLSRSFVERLRV